MADFKDRLWHDLVREHAADLARIDRTAHRRPRRRMVAAGAAGLAAGGTALLVALGTSGTPPAFAVDRLPDGTVTVTINRIEGIPGANARLEALGIRVRAVPFVPGCAPLHEATPAQLTPAMRKALRFARARSGAIMSVRIAPWRLARDKVAVLAARPGQVDPATLVGEIEHGAIPRCVGPVPAPPVGSVVCTGDGKAVPLPRKERPPAAQGDRGNSGSPGTGGNSGSPGTGGNSGSPGPGGNSGSSSAGGGSGASGNVGGPGAARPGAVVCQAPAPPAGSSGNSGNSGDSGVTGNS